jgi:hypothetical protein
LYKKITTAKRGLVQLDYKILTPLDYIMLTLYNKKILQSLTGLILDANLPRQADA